MAVAMIGDFIAFRNSRLRKVTVHKLNRFSVSTTNDLETQRLEKIGETYAPNSRRVVSDPVLENARVMMVDRDTSVLDHLEACLKDSGIVDIQSCFDPEEAAHLIGFLTPDIVLVDAVGGIELLRFIRRSASLQSVGVIISADEIDPEQKLAALELGASAFLPRPIHSYELVLSIRNIIASKAYHDHLSVESNRLESEVRHQIVELEAARMDAEEARQRALQCLARAAEFRDDDTSHHVLRVGRYAALVASRFDFDQAQIALLEQAAQLHDVGKIGVSDTILLKPGKLTDDEFEKMRHHCEYGSNIILPMTACEWSELLCEPERTFEIVNQSGAPVMMLGALISRTHHEKWDGSGYPYGLQGTEIPLVGRITAIADVFDALSSARPYKEAFSIEKCFRIIREGRGSHFDPAVVDAFFDAEEEILSIKSSLAD